MAKIYKQMVKVFADLDGYVQKCGWNDFHKYKYMTELDLVAQIRPILCKHELFTVVRIKNLNNPGRMESVALEIDIVADDGSKVEYSTVGDGEDKGDKGLYKAITGAYKYWMQKGLMIGTGDDPERHDPEVERKSQPVAQAPTGGQEGGQDRSPDPGSPVVGITGETAARLREITRDHNLQENARDFIVEKLSAGDMTEEYARKLLGHAKALLPKAGQ